MKKIYFITCLLLAFSFSNNLCHAQLPKTYFPILRNTYWATDQVACDTMQFVTGKEVLLFNCSFAMDTISGTYKFIADDTIVAEFTLSTGAAHWPKEASYSPPPFKPFRSTYYFNINNYTLTTVVTEQKNSKGDWVKVEPIDANITNYNWYKAQRP